MTKAVIIGGSVSGLAGALALGDLGYDVEILERDPHLPPADVADAQRWQRPTVPQTVHSHAFGSLGVNLLRERAPEVHRELLAAGATEIRLGDRKPPFLTDQSSRPEDAELAMLASRRSVFELVLRRETLRRTGIVYRPGSTVRGLEFARGGAPRVTGVRLEDGRTVRADLVVDASGRRSPVAQWLTDAGLPAGTVESHSCEITYYTRFYRSLTKTPAGPLNRGFGAGGLWDSYTAVLFLGDNDTFSVSLGVLPQDRALKGLRTEKAFTAAVRATPLLAPWIAPGAAEPISPVHAMGGLDNSLRTAPAEPVPGLVALGDSAGTTNPAYGRGVSLAIAHAYRLAATLAEYPDAGPEQARAVAETTDRLLRPWFDEAVANDRGRAALWRATAEGAAPPRPPEGVLTFGAVAEAAATDALVWRRLVRVMMSLATPDTVYADDEVREHVAKALAGGPAFSFPGAGRDQLVAACADPAV